MAITPAVRLTGAILLALGMVLLVVFLATRPAWTGLTLEVDGEGHVLVAQARGPSAEVPLGQRLIAIGDGQRQLGLEALDLSIEPDGSMGDYVTWHRFLARQQILSEMQAAPVLSLWTDAGEAIRIEPLPTRPIGSLPVSFWVQLVVGVMAWLISAAVFAVRPAESSARYLLLSGLATLTFAPLAAVYSTRELALPAISFQWLNDLNHLGGTLFIASFIALLLHYPRRLGPAWTASAVLLAYLAWYAAQLLGLFESMTFARRFHVMIGVLVTFVLAAVHWRGTARDPAARAALQWFLLSWMVGTSAFALLILLPQLFGIDTSAVQGYGFLLFVLVYGGLAFGILRYRLFDLGRWWGRVVLWMLTVLLLVVLDVLFLSLLHLSAEMSLALALLICGLIWVPLRGLIWGRLLRDAPHARHPALFRQVMDVALTPPGDDQCARWKALLESVFEPLSVEPVVADSPGGHSNDEVRVALDGQGLALRVGDLRLLHAGGGRRLFTPDDVALASELCEMRAHANRSRDAYERGATEERTRIARDMHDNIGARLLGALYSREPVRKDSLIRETLADLRDIVSQASGPGLPLEEALADLRQEVAETLGAAGLALEWQMVSGGGLRPGASVLHALRSIIREAMRNAIRHAGAGHLRVQIEAGDGGIRLAIEDDGHGFDANGCTEIDGRRTSNMRSRVVALGGAFRLDSDARGTRITATIPLPGLRGSDLGSDQAHAGGGQRRLSA
jgi:two-component system sensor histidine kinase DevS